MMQASNAPCRSGAPAAKAFAHSDAIRGEAPLQPKPQYTVMCAPAANDPCRSGALAAKVFAHSDAIRGEAPLQPKPQHTVMCAPAANAPCRSGAPAANDCSPAAKAFDIH